MARAEGNCGASAGSLVEKKDFGGTQFQEIAGDLRNPLGPKTIKAGRHLPLRSKILPERGVG